MNRYGIRGQIAWFAFGTWAGDCFVQLFEVVYRGEFKIRSTLNDGSGLPIMLFLAMPLSVFFAIGFGGWLWFRSRKRGSCQTPWAIPFLGGLFFIPLCAALIPVLCIICRQDQGTIIGTAVAALIYGLPVVSAEICLRMSRYREHPRSGVNGEGTAGNALVSTAE